MDMPTVRESRFCAIDFESAGAARGGMDEPVQVGLAEWSPEAGRGGVFDSLLRIRGVVSPAARKVHGIGVERLAGAPALLELWPELRSRLGGAVVVAHGKGTEKRFLRAFPGHGFGPWVDSLLLARAVWPGAPDHSLGALCEARGLAGRVREWVPGRDWHDALFDAAASLVLLEHIIRECGLEDLGLEFLCSPDLSGWHRQRRSGGGA
jgi:DNA polymerase III subunit epsilon